MKTVIRLFLVALMVLFIGCGGGSGGTPTDVADGETLTNEDFIRYTPEVFQATQNAYDFNSDGTSLLRIEQLILNQWENPFPSDSFASADKAGKREFYEFYIASAITQAEETLPIYAPQGSAGDFIIDVQNGIADFTDYQLPADIDGDGRVTLEEDAKILIDALVDNLSGSIYDINHDNSVDNRDLLYLIAHLLTQADSFHFYTTDGQELGIEAQSWGDNYRVYLSSLTDIPQQIRIIVRDINGASSVKDTPSITQNEWYKSATLEARSLQKRDEVIGCTLDSSVLSNLFPEAESEYVIGFQASVKHVMGHTVNGNLIAHGDLSSCFSLVGLFYFHESKVHQYFVPYNMNEAPNWASGGVTFAVRDGFYYDKDLLKDISAWNDYSKDIPTEVHGKNTSVKTSHTKGDTIIYTYSMVNVNAVYHESDAKYPLKGKVVRDAQDKYDDCGALIFDRIGPASQTDSKRSTELEKDGAYATSYEFKDNLAMGHHTGTIMWEKGATYQLEDNYMFIKDETSHDFQIPMHKDSVKGKVLDANNEPVAGVKVSLISTCQGGPDRKYSTSKEDGSYEFQEVDIGEYDIQIDLQTKATVAQVGSAVEKEIKTDSLWKLHVRYSSSLAGSGEMTIKKFPLDFEKPINNWYAFVGNDYKEYEEGTTIEYSGIFYDEGLSPLLIYYDTYLSKNLLEWSALKNIADYPPELNPVQIGSAIMATNFDCDGTLSQAVIDKVNNNEEAIWTSPSGVSGTPTCHFTLSPCQNSECSDEDDSEKYDDFDDEFNTPTEDNGEITAPEGGLGD